MCDFLLAVKQKWNLTNESKLQMALESKIK